MPWKKNGSKCVMKCKRDDNFDLLIIIAGTIFFILLSAISWALVCGIVKIITLCIGCAFNLKVATLVWLIVIVLGIAVRR